MRGPLERKTEVRSVGRTAYTVAHLCEQLTGTLGTRGSRGANHGRSGVRRGTNVYHLYSKLVWLVQLVEL